MEEEAIAEYCMSLSDVQQQRFLSRPLVILPRCEPVEARVQAVMVVVVAPCRDQMAWRRVGNRCPRGGRWSIADWRETCLAGVVGFEPTVHGTKNRCLTTWLHPNGPR